jgi:hypothetical protein
LDARAPKNKEVKGKKKTALSPKKHSEIKSAE